MAPRRSNPLDDVAELLSQRVTAGLAKIGLAMRWRAWREGGPRRLTPTQGQILAHLAGTAADSTMLCDLAEALAITPATACVAVRALAAKGLVVRARSRGDARRLSIRLTKAGRREAARVRGWWDFLASAVEALNPGEQEVLLRALIKMVRVLQLRGQIPVARMCVTCRFFRPYVHNDPRRPHHCAFVNAPFGGRDLRLECPDHETADPRQAARSWRRFISEEAPPGRGPHQTVCSEGGLR